MMAKLQPRTSSPARASASLPTVIMREIVHLQAGQCGNQIGAKGAFGASADRTRTGAVPVRICESAKRLGPRGSKGGREAEEDEHWKHETAKPEKHSTEVWKEPKRSYGAGVTTSASAQLISAVSVWLGAAYLETSSDKRLLQVATTKPQIFAKHIHHRGSVNDRCWMESVV
uniref:Uncharacterized protein n=1 Tax=Anopheles atroparvus TaxID=41427 RepID=A0A182IRA4_ANOAO